MRHSDEIRRNRLAWPERPLLRAIYGHYYRRIATLVSEGVPGPVIELGSGIGSIKHHVPNVITTDLFANEWLDLVCDGYALPFADRTAGHLVMFDVFHHLRRPNSFLREARRVLRPGGRVVLLEPFISVTSYPVYAFLHPEPVAWRDAIDASEVPPQQDYYVAQGNATRLFFGRTPPSWLAQWRVARAEVFSAFAYLLSGGYSRRPLYPTAWLGLFARLDRSLSRWPRLFGARCLIALEPC